MQSLNFALEQPPPIAWDDVDLYRFFAFAFGPPSAARFQWFQQPGIESAIRQLSIQLGCDSDLQPFSWYSTFEDYESAYIGIFDVGAPEPPVALFESAHYKAVPAQQTAFENSCFYEVIGLRTNPQQAVPDYLLTQLEFLAAVQYGKENSPSADACARFRHLELDFLERHLLNWLPAAEDTLKATRVIAFPALMSLLVRFAQQRRALWLA